jgi:pimeloyl-ACP methyl ester carboxylesterase
VEIFRERVTRARDGTGLFYTDRGRGRAMVLLDGLVCDGFVWRYLEPWFAARTRVVHPHYRGHGRSALPADTRTRLEDLVDDLEAVRRDAGIETFVLCGHSMGVQVALEYARRRPSRVDGLVLICGSPGRILAHFQNTDRLALLLPVVRRAYWRNPARMRWLWENFPVRLAYRLAMATSQVNPLLTRRPDLYVYLRHLRQVDMDIYMSLVESMNEYDASPHLPGIAMPSLVISAQNDTFMPPSSGEHMARSMPDAEFLLVRGGSHTLPV